MDTIIIRYETADRGVWTSHPPITIPVTATVHLSEVQRMAAALTDVPNLRVLSIRYVTPGAAHEMVATDEQEAGWDDEF